MNDSIISTDSYVYFLYSETQYAKRKEIDKRLSKVFTLGTVIVNGKKYSFTEMARNNKNNYPDCKVVAEGWKSSMTYTPVKSV